jgi:hypothetical protein
MKKLILIIGILIGLTNVVSAEVREDTVKSKNSLTQKRDIKKNFETSFTNELVKYIETGDTTLLSELINEDDMAFLARGEYVDSEDKNYFFEYLKRHLDIKGESYSVQNTDDVYIYYTFPDGEGGAFKFSLFYPNSDRYDDVIVTYGGNAKLISMTIHTEANDNPYFDGNLNKIVGGEFGYYGIDGQKKEGN